jgi:glucose-1-phosphate cytidylyltransferase
MKLVILAGGLGSRLSEETTLRPKPLVEIGGMPIIWHIMKYYSYFGFKEFLICLGYKGHLIKDYFHRYHLLKNDLTIEIGKGIEFHNDVADDWSVTLVDTGISTQTGGRLKRIREFIGEENFCLTYGDGLGDVDIDALLNFHKSHGKIVTVTAVHPPARFGALRLSGTRVEQFVEKPTSESGWINGGFFAMKPQIFDFIEGDSTALEQSPLQTLAKVGELQAFFHEGFWQPMDTLREKNLLQELWDSEKAPWKVWA